MRCMVWGRLSLAAGGSAARSARGGQVRLRAPRAAPPLPPGESLVGRVWRRDRGGTLSRPPPPPFGPWITWESVRGRKAPSCAASGGPPSRRTLPWRPPHAPASHPCPFPGWTPAHSSSRHAHHRCRARAPVALCRRMRGGRTRPLAPRRHRVPQLHHPERRRRPTGERREGGGRAGRAPRTTPVVRRALRTAALRHRRLPPTRRPGACRGCRRGRGRRRGRGEGGNGRVDRPGRAARPLFSSPPGARRTSCLGRPPHMADDSAATAGWRRAAAGAPGARWRPRRHLPTARRGPGAARGRRRPPSLPPVAARPLCAPSGAGDGAQPPAVCAAPGQARVAVLRRWRRRRPAPRPTPWGATRR
jgi:hypothetical protein